MIEIWIFLNCNDCDRLTKIGNHSLPDDGWCWCLADQHKNYKLHSYVTCIDRFGLHAKL